MTYRISPQVIALLKQELARCNNNTAALARKIGINPSYIFKYINGTVKSVQAGTWLKLCRYFPELDERPMLFRGNTGPVTGTLRQVPVISSASAAEACRHYYLPIAEYALDHPEQMVSFSLGQAGDFAIQVTGDSMAPSYPEGRFSCGPMSGWPMAIRWWPFLQWRSGLQDFVRQAVHGQRQRRRRSDIPVCQDAAGPYGRSTGDSVMWTKRPSTRP